MTMNKKAREAFIEKVRSELVGTADVASMLGITKTRLNKIEALQVIVRGFYLRQDVEAYMNDAAVQERREKHTVGAKIAKEVVKKVQRGKVVKTV